MIDSVYPQGFVDSQERTEAAVAGPLDGKPTATIASPGDGVVLAFDEQGLLSLAPAGRLCD